MLFSALEGQDEKEIEEEFRMKEQEILRENLLKVK